MDLRRPVGLGVGLQALEEPRALELDRLFRRRGLAAAQLPEDAAQVSLGVGRGEDAGRAVVGDHAARLREERMALRHRLKKIIIGLHGHLRSTGKLVLQQKR